MKITQNIVYIINIFFLCILGILVLCPLYIFPNYNSETNTNKYIEYLKQYERYFMPAEFILIILLVTLNSACVFNNSCVNNKNNVTQNDI